MKKIFAAIALLALGLSCVQIPEVSPAGPEQIKLSVLSTYATGTFDESAAEIPAFDPGSRRLFFANADANTIEILDLSDPAHPGKIAAISMAAVGGGVNSVAACQGVVAAAVEADDKQDNGMIVFMDTDGNILNTLPAGALPDMITFSKNGKYVLTANEGEPDDDYTPDPRGSVTIVKIGGKITDLTAGDVHTLYFDGVSLENNVRITGPAGTSPAADLEPEYIAVSGDSRYAYVTLQENNAIAKIDLAGPAVTLVKGLGTKDHSVPDNALDAVEDGRIDITTWPLKGLFMPDAIAAFTVGGREYLITANEGDGREYDDYEDETKVGKIELDPGRFPGAAQLQADTALASFVVSAVDGDIDGDGDFDELYSFGARSFTIWNEELEPVFDSGDDFEQIMAREIPAEYFNASNDGDDMDDRSPKKGPEPEGVTVAEIEGSYFAFVLLERISGVMVYNVSDPASPRFVQYINNRVFGQDAEAGRAGDLGPEGVVFIPAADSPSGVPLLVVANEVSGTVTIYSIEVL